jgi:hypothetical protein
MQEGAELLERLTEFVGDSLAKVVRPPRPTFSPNRFSF